MEGGAFRFLEGEVRRLKDELGDKRKKVDELKGELMDKERKIERQDKQLSEAAEIMMEQQTKLEGEQRKLSELEGKWTSLKGGCGEVYVEFKRWVKELEGHFKECCEKKKGGGEMIGRRLGEMKKLVRARFGEVTRDDRKNKKMEDVQVSVSRKMEEPKKTMIMSGLVVTKKRGRPLGSKKKIRGKRVMPDLRGLEETRGQAGGDVILSRRRSTIGEKGAGGLYQCEECKDKFEGRAEFLKHKRMEHGNSSTTVDKDVHHASKMIVPVEEATTEEDNRMDESAGSDITLPPPPPQLSVEDPPQALKKGQGQGKPFHRSSRYPGKEHKRDASKPGYCCVCGAQFQLSSSFHMHIRTQTQERKWQCSVCSKRFHFISHLKRHEKGLHGRIGGRVVTASLRRKKVKGSRSSHKCPECGDKFGGMAEMLKHKRIEHEIARNVRKVTVTAPPAAPESNQKDDKVIVPKRKGRPSIRKIHGVDESKSGPGFYCICGVERDSKSKLLAHLKTTNQDGKFKCDTCHKRFPFLSFLRKHQVNAHGMKVPDKKTHGCRQCGKEFGTVKELFGHQKLKHNAFRRKQNAVAPVENEDDDISVISTLNTSSSVTLSTASLARLPLMSSIAKSFAFSRTPKVPESSASPSPNSSQEKSASRLPSPSGSTPKSLSKSILPSKCSKTVDHEVVATNPRECLCGYSNNLTFYVKRHVEKMNKKEATEAAQEKLLDNSTSSNHHQHSTTSSISPVSMPKLVLRRLEEDLFETEIIPAPTQNIPILEQPEYSEPVPVEPLSAEKPPRYRPEYRTPGKTKVHSIDQTKLDHGFYCVCGSEYKSKLLLERHVEYFNKERKFRCHLCPRRCINNSSLKKHLMQTHKVSGDVDQANTNGNGIKIATVTTKLYQGHERIKKRVRIRSRFTCSICHGGFTCRTQAQLLEHRKQVHGLVRKTRKWTKPRSPMDSPPNLVDAPVSHPEPESLESEPIPIPIPIPIYCEYDTVDEEEIDYNQVIKVEPLTVKPSQTIKIKLKPAPTSTVGSSLGIRKNSLVKHRVDPRVPSNRCMCGKEFSTKETLVTHIRYKTQIWRFRCHLCTKRFFFLGFLKTHLRKTHKISGDKADEDGVRKQVGCGDCGKRFDTRPKFLKHRKSVHKKNAFQKET